MKFKHNKDKEDWAELSDGDDKHQKLRSFIEKLEMISVLAGRGELTVTSFIRENNKSSLHYYGRAVDIRVRDKTMEWYYAMSLIGMAIGWLSNNIRMNPHYELYGEPQQHIHIEIRG